MILQICSSGAALLFLALVKLGEVLGGGGGGHTPSCSDDHRQSLYPLQLVSQTPASLRFPLSTNYFVVVNLSCCQRCHEASFQ